MSSIREDIVKDIIKVLKEIDPPRPVLVTREPFNVEELAITQFPAILVQTGTEDRDLLTMPTMNSKGRKSGVINYLIRVFVRGSELDSKRNEMIERIDEILDSDRYRSKALSVVQNSQITSIEVVERQAPLAEVTITFQVEYNYLMGTA
tara:strand:+ start:1396 stop:1842 length:447 start_codon:yes stop_codon:yes gene_type:complete